MTNNKPVTLLLIKTVLSFLIFSMTHLIMADEIGKLIPVCSACHGENGLSLDPSIPNLAGQKSIYMASELKFMRDGIRTNSLMEAVVKDLSDQQLDQLANYYSKLPASSTGADQVNLQGKNTRAVCISCHGTKGITVNEQWPNLAGQKKKYLQKQLLAFRDDSRLGSNMQVIAKELNDAQIEAVAEYYSQLPGK